MSRPLRLTLVSVLGAGLVCAALAAFLLATERGLQLLWRQAARLLPPEISIQRLEGRIIGPLGVQGLRYESQTLRVKLDAARLEWSPARLLTGTLWLDRVALQGLSYISLGPAPAAPGEKDTFTLPESIPLPLRVVVGELSLREATYSPAAESEPLLLDHARLSGEAGRRQWSISRLSIQAPRLDLAGSARLQVDQDYRIEADTQWQLRPPGYPPVDGATVLGGSLRELLVTQTLSPPYRSRAELTLNDPLGQFRFTAKWRLEEIAFQTLDPSLPPLRINGELTGAGDLEESRITAALHIRDPDIGELQALFDGELSPGALVIDNLRLALTGQPGFIETRGEVLIDRQQPVLALRTVWEELQWPLQGTPMVHSRRGTADITGTLDRLSAEVDMLLLQQGRLQGTFQQRGRQLEGKLQWQHLSWPEQQPRVASPEGKMELSGTLESYRFSLAARLTMPDRADGRVELEGRGDLASAQLSTFAVTTLGGELLGTAELAWQPRPKARLEVTGQGLDPGVLVAGWTGDLAVQLETTAEMREGQLLARVDQLDVTGKLRGYPLRLKAQGGFDAKGLRLSDAAVASGATTLNVSGLVGESLDLRWQVQSSDLASLIPSAAGRLQGRGVARGTLDSPRLEAELKGEDLRYGPHALQRFSLETSLDASGDRDSRLRLEATGGSVAENRIERLMLIGNGKPNSHRLELDARTSRGDAELRLTAGIRGERWQFQLMQARLKYPGLAAWTLHSPGSGWISKDAGDLSLSRSCWTSGEALLCLAGARSPDAWQGEFDLQNLPFDYFAAWLPPEVEVQGKVSGRGRLAQPAAKGETTATIQFETSGGALLSPVVDDDRVPILAFRPGRARFDLKRQAMSLAVNLPFEAAGGLEMEARLPAGDRPLQERPLSGNLVLRVPDISVIGDLLPEVERAEGRLDGEATLSGTLAAPRFRGRLVLKDGAAELSGPGIRLSGIEVVLSGREQGAIDVSARARSGPGDIRVEGRADITAVGLESDLFISGEEFQLLELPEARVRVSPAMQLRLNESKMEIEGDVRVPYARIKLRSLPESAVAVSPDQVIVQGEEEVQKAAADRRRINARLRVILGDDVRFDGLGLKARLAGDLLLIEKPERLTTASGEVRLVDGTYKAYGQNLSITRGRLQYAGGLVSEPGLDVRAVRRPVEGVEVGVEARGTLKNPQFTLFSDPAMSQSEQLSYLVLGRPLEGGTSSEEGNAVNQAALALGLAGGGLVAEQFGEPLGLDTVGIETGPNESTEAASLVVGKYLSPKLYVGYGVGLFDPISTIWLRYTITSNWKLVTESSSEASGADLYYTIDRGR